MDVVRSKQGRYPVLISLSGVPGAGKTTLATSLVQWLNNAMPECGAIAMSIDGYHRLRAELSAAEMEHRGSPPTFNAAQLLADLVRLKRTGVLDAPSFDHAVGDPRPNAIAIRSNNHVVIVEGLYLLLQQDEEWKSIARLFDFKVYLKVPLHVSTERVARRHMKAWNWPYERALARAQGNDLTNARLVDASAIHADLVVETALAKL